jgi:hypothetical protein
MERVFAQCSITRLRDGSNARLASSMLWYSSQMVANIPDSFLRHAEIEMSMVLAEVLS